MSKRNEEWCFEVVEMKTGEVTHTVWCGDASESQRERVERGLLMRVDMDRFFVRETRKAPSAPREA